MSVTQCYSLNFNQGQSSSFSASSYTYNYTPSLPTWAASTGYNPAQKIVDSNGNLQLSSGGVSNSGAHPTWNVTIGGTTADGTITWTNGGTPEVISVGDLLYVVITATITGSDVTGVTDSLGNTFVATGGDPFFSQIFGRNLYMRVFTATSVANVANGGAYHITANFLGSTDSESGLAIFSNLSSAAGTVSVSSFSQSPYMGNSFRAGPISAGSVSNPVPAITIFSYFKDFTEDTSTAPTYTFFPWGDGGLTRGAGFSATPAGTQSPFILSLTSSGGQFVGWCATLSYFATMPGSITTAPSSSAIMLGMTQQFTATGNYCNGVTADYTSLATWNSSNPGVATINSSGLATAVGVGSTNISVTYLGVTSNFGVLTVNPSHMITLTGGNIQDATGKLVPVGTLKLTLQTDAVVIGVGGQVFAGLTVTFPIVNGNLSGVCRIWSNVELDPESYYLVNIFDQNGAGINFSPLVWRFMQPGGTTVDIGTMTDQS